MIRAALTSALNRVKNAHFQLQVFIQGKKQRRENAAVLLFNNRVFDFAKKSFVFFDFHFENVFQNQTFIRTAYFENETVNVLRSTKFTITFCFSRANNMATQRSCFRTESGFSFYYSGPIAQFVNQLPVRPLKRMANPKWNAPIENAPLVCAGVATTDQVSRPLALRRLSLIHI